MATSPNLVVLDGRPDDSEPWEKPAFEAFIRKIWTEQPGCKIIYLAHQAVTDQNDNGAIFADPLPYQDAVDNALAICAHYGITAILDDVPAIQAAVTGGADLSDYYADVIHPTVLGQQIIFSLLEPYLPTGGSSRPAALPDYLHAETADYMNDSVRINGVDYDSRTGTWADTGTRTDSSQVGATITFSATCQTWGIYRPDGTSVTVEVSIDGGAYADRVLTHNGIPITGGRGAHTITIRVKATAVRIDEFWAI